MVVSALPLAKWETAEVLRCIRRESVPGDRVHPARAREAANRFVLHAHVV